METAERVPALCRDKYPDFNVRHFHEKLREREGLSLSCSAASASGFEVQSV
jgi:hypothetical protein